jgi:hypothetical protein
MFRSFRPRAVLSLLVIFTAMTTQSMAKTANADKMNARFEKLADASIGRRLGRSHPICAIERVRSKRRRGSGVGWSVVYGCNRKANDGSRKRFSLQAVAEITSFTFDHPTIAIRHRRDFKKNSEKRGGTNNIDTRRTRWAETDKYTARLKERIIAWRLARKSDSHSATAVADGKQRFTGLRKDNDPRPDSDPIALRVTVKVKMGYDKMRSLRADAGEVAMQIADDIWKGIVGTKDVCDRVNQLPVKRQAKGILSYLCKHDLVLSLKFNRPPLRLAGYIKDEDGTVPAIRTEFETTVFREIKRRLMAPRSGEKKLRPQSLFWLTVRKMDTIERSRSSKRRYPVIALEALLTAHNVTRLLARPEQWIGTYPYNAYGGDRTIVDSAFPVLEDLIGRNSVDGQPTFYARYKMRQRDPYPVFERFFNKSGPFYFHAPSRRAVDAETSEPDGFNYPSHFNAGIHYYFWVGAIVKNVASNMAGGSSRFGSVAQWATYLYELTQKKYATRNEQRGRIQLDNGFTKGADWWGRLSASLEELKEHAPARVRP